MSQSCRLPGWLTRSIPESVAAGFEAECESRLSPDQDPLPEHFVADAVGSQNLRPGRLLRALEHVNNEDDM